VQDQNAKLPIDVKPLGTVTDVKEPQDENATEPIEVTLLGIVKLENALQFRNAKQASLELTVADKQP